MRIRIYTDGACSVNPGPGGWAIVVNTADTCYTYSGCEAGTTNNRMELTGVCKALEYIVTQGSAADVFEIFCDSAYVVNGVNNNWLCMWKLNGWKTRQGNDIKNRDLWELVHKNLIEARKQGKAVTMVKIKGHAGNTFNELVDQLAKSESAKARTGQN